VNKGTFAALERAKVFQKKYDWFLKLDVRKYFDSISHEVLKSLLVKRFKDAKLLRIFDSVIDSYQTQPQKGVPIGNLTSQYFANHYLAIADHFIKEKLKIEAYTRYMDDMVLWSNDKTDLLKKGIELSHFMSSTLQLELKPFCLNRNKQGLPFLGYLVFPESIKLNKNSRERFAKKLTDYEQNLSNDIWSESDYQRHVLPLLSFIKKADSFGFRRKCMEHMQIGQWL
jgi:hypothetical protein